MRGVWGLSLWWWLSLAPGCVPRPGLQADFLPDERLKDDPSKFPGEPAVGLWREVRVFGTLRVSEKAYSQKLEHVVIAIRSEPGFEYGKVTVRYGKKNKLVAIKARVRQSD